MRHAREHSPSGYYHVIMRGINRQTVFECPEDFEHFLALLHLCLQEGKTELLKKRASLGYSVHAYCLMANHVHILIASPDKPPGALMRKLTVRYAMWFNKKYERVGHLFQDRYLSQAINSNAQFLACVRYIHLNPVKAGICKAPEKYPYSSYGEYVGGAKIADTKPVLDMLAPNSKERVDAFVEFMSRADKNGEGFIEDTPSRISDRQAKQVMYELSGASDTAQFQEFSCEKRDEYLCLLRKCQIPLRQIARITGVSYGIVRNRK